MLQFLACVGIFGILTFPGESYLLPVRSDPKCAQRIVQEFSHQKTWLVKSLKNHNHSVHWPNLRRQHDKFEALELQKNNVGKWFIIPDGQSFETIAAEDIATGETLLQFPVEFCIRERDGGLWDVHLAVKLLRERSKGAASKWAWYIRHLPEHIPLPIYFSDMEIGNIKDSLVTDEIFAMRKLILSSFEVYSDNKGITLSDFAWAMSIVYSASYEHNSVHFLAPLSGVNMKEYKENVYLRSSVKSLSIRASQKIKKGEVLVLASNHMSGSDAFLFRGIAKNNSNNERVKLFKDAKDLAEWYFSEYEGVNRNKFLTMKVANDGDKNGEFTVGTKGYLSPSLVGVLASLDYAKRLIDLHNTNKGGEAPLDFENEKGTVWERNLNLIEKKSIGMRASALQSSSSSIDTVDQSLEFASMAIKKRVASILKSYSTDEEEDGLLLKAADWEGVDDVDEDDECSSCRWQIEKMSYNDKLATAFRASRRVLLEDVLSKFGFPTIAKSSEDGIFTYKPNNDSIQRFSSWCNDNGLDISHKLTVMPATSKSKLNATNGSSVRRVIVNKDVDEGETLCTLSLDAGLFDDSTPEAIEADSWDLAAARLLQERALGNASRWAPYINILPQNMASPIYLYSNELHEIQWLPTIRELIQVRKSIKESFELLKAASKLDFVEYEEYRWAVIMVHSRAFTLPVLPGEKYSHYVLMPFMDMINHHYIYQADWMSQPVIDGNLEIIARRKLKKGDELFASFGPRSNDNLFLYYGFVLKDNPFDSAKLFKSYKHALIWFMNTWSGDCVNGSSDLLTCKRQRWNKIWPLVKKGIKDFEANGAVGGSKEWWELVSKWADYGYQYLPYQPGPTIYSYGVTDPSLISVFQTASNLTLTSSFPAATDTNSSSLKGFLTCMEEAQVDYKQPLLQHGHSCERYLHGILQVKNQEDQHRIIARISVAVRCLEMLSSFPTSISQDELLLLRVMDDDTGKKKNIHMDVTREYRFRKKLLIRAVVDRLEKEEEEEEEEKRKQQLVFF